ncbi:MAG TPA: hypothetical protein DCR74_10265 [Achromobacter sp.]|nr:hypothetical protein [Achromobacter sp.]
MSRPISTPERRLRLLTVSRWWGRMCGLLGRAPPGPRAGVLLTPCAAVHTFWMRYAIDVAFIGRNGQVVGLRRALAPWRVALCLRAVAVVEMRAGVIDAEHGGIGRIEAAVQDAARRNVERNLQRAGKLGRQPDGDQQSGAQIDEQEHHDPADPVHHERQLVAPARDAGEEQRLRQAQAVPGHQHGRMPEQRRDHHVADREQHQWHGHGRQNRFHALFDRGDAHAFHDRIGKGQEDGEACHQAKAGIQQTHQEQLAEHARLF